MGRLVKPDNVGKTRDRLMKAMALTLRGLATRPSLDETARDMAAFLALALHEINETIDVTCAAWEKRDYWLKADQFRRDWLWVQPAAVKIEAIVLEDMWAELPGQMAGLAGRLDKVVLPKRNTLGEPWVGAYAALREKRGLEKTYSVR
ncbi:MAG TPA: hypothetical protein PLC98_12480 [Anaerolineales bacterium]|nr:hypothetical protein [Anaerolineales bacterium]